MNFVVGEGNLKEQRPCTKIEKTVAMVKRVTEKVSVHASKVCTLAVEIQI